MARGWRYRIASVLGTAGLAAFALWFVNLPLMQRAFAVVPYVGNPAPAILTNGELFFAIATTLVVALGATWPLFKPRPRRVLDTILLTQKRVLLAMVVLAAMGYFDYTWALPRSTLMLSTVALVVWLPAYMVAIRRQPSDQSRAVIVGDDPQAMEAILAATELPVIGYVSPPSSYAVGEEGAKDAASVADGGRVEAQSRLDRLTNLGGLSRLEDVFVAHNVDTALLAFADTDRPEFFGTLDTCYEHGVAVKVHRDHADDVLTSETVAGELADVDLEPWDWQDHVLKRAFDVVFSLVGLVALSPVMAVIALVIKAEDGGPVFYRQVRTATFGDTFSVAKFRTMVPEGESARPVGDDENTRITRVGRVLRRTHLDEIPQLWSILVGEMSVVGPRAAWTKEEELIEDEAGAWRLRWFVKPGLTGLAQINGADSTDPEAKVRYDLEYIREQSFWYDLKIVLRQVWKVLVDLEAAFRQDGAP